MADAQLSDLDLALLLADEADALSLPRFRAHDFSVESKPDLTPVTEVDRAVEARISELLLAHRPGDGMLGEEYGTREAGSRMWIVDPIDGTKNFVRGVPVYATLISLYDGETPVLGVVSAPAMGMRWWAEIGSGAYRRTTPDAAPERISVSSVFSLADASLSYSSLGGWREHRSLERFMELTDAVWRTRAYGDFWSYLLVAEGAVDLAAEPELETYDMGALVPIVLEAGGAFTDLDGRPGPWGGCALASNGRLHDAALGML